jgi:peptide/nickel transport system ATP-binding protein
MTALLEISGLEVGFPMAGGLLGMVTGRGDRITAVAGVSLTVEAGTTFAIVGESGSGKTTLARAVNGLVAAGAGSIRFEGQELLGLSEADFKPLRRQIAMMFQDPVGSLSPRLTVGALLQEPFRIQGLAARDVGA